MNISDKDFRIHIKEKIESLIKENDIVSAIDTKSSTGKNIKQYDLYKYVDTFTFYYKGIERELKHSGILKDSEYLKPASCWTVIGKEYSFHTIHRHNEKNVNHLASVFYLSVSENDKNRPGSFYAIDDEIVTIDPLVGDLLFFPTYLYHGTYPQGPGIRQTLNMDFEVI
jgi:hypothetical protein